MQNDHPDRAHHKVLDNMRSAKVSAQKETGFGGQEIISEQHIAFIYDTGYIRSSLVPNHTPELCD
jgi:hypothetical protein